MSSIQQLIAVLNTGNIPFERDGNKVTVSTDGNGAKTTFLFDGPGTMLMGVSHN